MIKVMMEGFKLYNHNKWPREKIMEYSSKCIIDDLDVEGIKEYQFVQTSDESLILNCVKLPNAGEDVEEEIKRQLDQFLSKKKLRNVKYEVHFTGTLQIDKITGKVKMVINAIKQE
ncbi:hypothetical protein [Thermoanaerobacter sp. A7A]|uniref:hypothetical protein n=1 Tax=Thermoanaerobacter sp. A7A TaxID=1350366 RepID=UPI0003F85678|nr:hypothetical protein [Thermoanaerobacter sp. A7A]